MSFNSEREKIKQIMEVTNLSSQRSSEVLRSYNWNVNAALDNWLSQPTEYQQFNTTYSSKCNTKHIKALFNTYTDSDKIIADGSERLCQDLDIEPTQLRFLLLSYKLESATLGVFSYESFEKGCIELGADTTEKLKKAINTKLIDEFNSDEGFDKIYKYAFSLCKQATQKNLELEAAVELWQMLLADKFSLLEDWIDFLKVTKGGKKVKIITRDTWDMINHFRREFSSRQDLKKYDPNSNWPVLIDEFVENMKDKVEL